MKIVMLFGAGASFGSGDCIPHPPPLGKDLFSELCQLGGVASSVVSPLREQFAADFEQGMFALRNDINRTIAFQREIATYFTRFALGNENHYRDLIKAIRTSRHDVILVTTNYEMLIEEALSAGAGGIAYVTQPRMPNHIPILKIHGSVNFIPALGGVTIGQNDFRGDWSHTIVSSPTDFLWSGDEIIEFMQKQAGVAPSIAVYAPGKPVPFAPRFVAQVQEQWRAAAAAADMIFIIGLRVLPSDDHIWGTLAKTSGSLAYVGGEPEEFYSWAEACDKTQIEVLGSTFAAAMPSLVTRLATDGC